MREALKSFLDWAKGQPGEDEQILHRSFVDGDHVMLHYHVIRHEGDPGFAVIKPSGSDATTAIVAGAQLTSVSAKPSATNRPTNPTPVNAT